MAEHLTGHIISTTINPSYVDLVLNSEKGKTTLRVPSTDTELYIQARSLAREFQQEYRIAQPEVGKLTIRVVPLLGGIGSRLERV